MDAPGEGADAQLATSAGAAVEGVPHPHRAPDRDADHDPGYACALATKPFALIGALALLATTASADEKPRASTAPGVGPRRDARKCAEQVAQSFLIRSHWFRGTSPEDKAQGAKLHEEAIRYRTEKYGYFHGFGKREWNTKTPRDFATETTFFGLPLTLHAKVAPALRCVERALEESGAAARYKPRLLNGLRTKNTFHGGEVSNHVYGIALDIDADLNPCCGCAGKLREHPQCKKPVASVFQKAKIPKEWVDTFERYGFHWLGRDVLEDTMHFEFLGDPDKVFAE